MNSTFQQLCIDLMKDCRDDDRVNAKAKKPGMYLCLFHGRTNLDQDMDDWGTQGPDIGPLEYGHTTYGGEIKLNFKDVEDHDRFFIREVSTYFPAESRVEFTTEGILTISHDMVLYDGVYYGDWSFFYYDGK